MSAELPCTVTFIKLLDFLGKRFFEVGEYLRLGTFEIFTDTVSVGLFPINKTMKNDYCSNIEY